MNLADARLEIQLLKPNWLEQHKPTAVQRTVHATQAQNGHESWEVEFVRTKPADVSGKQDRLSTFVNNFLTHSDERRTCTVGSGSVHRCTSSARLQPAPLPITSASRTHLAADINLREMSAQTHPVSDSSCVKVVLVTVETRKEGRRREKFSKVDNGIIDGFAIAGFDLAYFGKNGDGFWSKSRVDILRGYITSPLVRLTFDSLRPLRKVVHHRDTHGERALKAWRSTAW